MSSPDERRAIIALQDRLIELLVAEEHADAAGDYERASRLRAEIDELKAEYQEVRRWVAVGTA